MKTPKAGGAFSLLAYGDGVEPLSHLAKRLKPRRVAEIIWGGGGDGSLAKEVRALQ